MPDPLDGPEPTRHSGPFASRTPAPGWAVIGIFLILAFGVIGLARDFLIPTTMAVLLFLVFVPLRRFLSDRGVPATATASLVTVGMIGVLGLIALIIMGPASAMIDSLPQISADLEAKINTLRNSMKGIQDAVEKIDKLSSGESPSANVVAVAQGSGIVTRMLSLTPSLFGQALFTLVLLFFLLSSGDLLYLRVVQSFSGMGQKRRAYAAIRQIETSLGSYMGTISMINAGLGVATGLAMWAWGMPAPAMFGVIGFALNFIPYLGAIGGTIMVTVVALVNMDGFVNPALVGATFLGLTAIEGQFVTPYFLSRRLEMNPVVVFLAVALWAWLWSAMGMIVAVPLLVVLRVLCDHIPGLESLGNFIDGAPTTDLGPEDESVPAGP